MFRKGKKRHSSSSSQSSEISTKSKSVDSSLGGLSRSSTVASLDTDSTKSSGQSNNNSDTCAEFRIKYVGAIEKLKLSEGKSLEGPLDLINYIDVAQQDGKLPFVPLEEEFIMGVSKYGIKVSTSDQYDVLHRHALYLIIRMGFIWQLGNQSPFMRLHCGALLSSSCPHPSHLAGSHLFPTLLWFAFSHLPRQKPTCPSHCLLQSDSWPVLRFSILPQGLYLPVFSNRQGNSGPAPAPITDS